MSTLDENGILRYDETDVRGTFSDLLNMGQDATSDAVGADRARLTVLEGDRSLSAVSGASARAASGWEIVATEARKKAGVVWARLRVKRTGAAVSVPSDGNIVNQLVATFKAGWVPSAGMRYPAAAADTGTVISGYVEAAGVYISAVPAGSSIPTNWEGTLSTCYPLA